MTEQQPPKVTADWKHPSNLIAHLEHLAKLRKEYDDATATYRDARKSKNPEDVTEHRIKMESAELYLLMETIRIPDILRHAKRCVEYLEGR